MKFEQAYEEVLGNASGRLNVVIPEWRDDHKCSQPELTTAFPNRRLNIPAGSTFECKCGQLWRVKVHKDSVSWERRGDKRFSKKAEFLDTNPFACAATLLALMLLVPFSVEVSMWLLPAAALIAAVYARYVLRFMFELSVSGLWESDKKSERFFDGYSAEYRALCMQDQDNVLEYSSRGTASF